MRNEKTSRVITTGSTGMLLGPSSRGNFEQSYHQGFRTKIQFLTPHYHRRRERPKLIHGFLALGVGVSPRSCRGFSYDNFIRSFCSCMGSAMSQSGHELLFWRFFHFVSTNDRKYRRALFTAKRCNAGMGDSTEHGVTRSGGKRKLTRLV